MTAEYDPERRVTKVPKVDRVTQSDPTQALDESRRGKFQAALNKAAEEQRLNEQHFRHHTYPESADRQVPAPRPDPVPDTPKSAPNPVPDTRKATPLANSQTSGKPGLERVPDTSSDKRPNPRKA